MKVVLLTAGAAGMYCGSCMHDNALARALRSQGVDCVLQPVYTPIRTDAASMAGDQVFFGGINIYMLQQLPWLRHIPAVLRRPLDWPPLISWATKRAAATDASKLGDLSVSMLQGTDGRQADEVRRLVDWLVDQMKPDAIVFSNLLIGGALPEIRRRLPNTKIVVVLQGDDIFMDHLPGKQRSLVVDLCRQLVSHVDHFITNSDFYADKMGQLLSIDRDKLVIAPLSIDLKPFVDLPARANTEQEFRLGYLARIAPEKGLHHLVDAFIQLAASENNQDLTLQVAGWLGSVNEPYLQSQQDKIDRAGLSDRFRYHGSPSLDDKVRFLTSLDLLSVPTDYHEPKGLFVLEALAAGVPVIQPNHGAFGAMIQSTGGGLLVPPNDLPALCQAIQELKDDPQRRQQLARDGQQNVGSKHTIEIAAEQLRTLLSGTGQ